MKYIYGSGLILVCLFYFACERPPVNVDQSRKDELKSLEIHRAIGKADTNYQDVFYVPIYSDLYLDVQNQNSLLAATLSIRNTSYADSLFVSKIDYFNTHGALVRSYINNIIVLPPMGTVNYVIEKEDDTGGSGANFIVAINAKNANIRPLIQAIMVGQNGNKGFAFSTDGYSLHRDE